LQPEEVATLLNIEPPAVSLLIRGRFHHFSAEKLLSFLKKLDQEVTLLICNRDASDQRQEGWYPCSTRGLPRIDTHPNMHIAVGLAPMGPISHDSHGAPAVARVKTAQITNWSHRRNHILRIGARPPPTSTSPPIPTDDPRLVMGADRRSCRDRGGCEGVRGQG